VTILDFKTKSQKKSVQLLRFKRLTWEKSKITLG